MGTRLRFAILGPLEVRRDGLPVRVGGPRQRALLALLLCNANLVVSRARLVDELMGDRPADSAERMLHVQISRLRKALAADGDDPRLLARAPGYLLRVEDGELDLHAFEQCLSNGRQALEHGDPLQAAVMLHQAESLWRGRALADLEFEPFARLEVQRLEELRLLAVEERIDAELALGRHSALCPELEALAGEHPLRERLRGQLMLALYRSGRQADALEVYRAGRSMLVEELALEPGPRLRQLERAILEQDVALELPRASSRGGEASALDAEAAFEQPDPTPTPYDRRRHRGRWAALALAVAAVLAAFVIAPDLGRSARRRVPPRGNVLALISPRGAVIATVPLGAPPTDVAAGFGSLWVSEADAGLVVRVDQRRRAVLAEIPIGTRPSRIIAAGGQVWVLDPANGTVSAIDPNTDTVGQTIAVGSDASDLALSDASLWVADQGHGTVTRLDPSSGLGQGVVRTGGDPSALAAEEGVVWVADDESGMMDRIDARTGAVTNTIRVGDAPAAVAATTAAVWVLDPLDATLSRVDPRRDGIVATVPLGGAPASLAPFGGYVWVGDEQQGTVLRVDPRSGLVTSTVKLGGRVSALAAAGGLWAAVDAAGASHSGGTLTSVAPNGEIDTIDPAASTSWNVSPPQELGLTNDGLVTSRPRHRTERHAARPRPRTRPPSAERQRAHLRVPAPSRDSLLDRCAGQAD